MLMLSTQPIAVAAAVECLKEVAVVPGLQGVVDSMTVQPVAAVTAPVVVASAALGSIALGLAVLVEVAEVLVKEG